MSKYTITFQYSSDNWKSEFLEFKTKEDAQAWADKEKVERKAKNVFVR